jgi:hypothetical protein
MVCPICPAVACLGGWMVGYFGIRSPEYSGGRLLCAAVSANLMGITVIALKVLFGISLCSGGAWTLGNIVRVGAKTAVMGMIYLIGVNHFLNSYVSPHPGGSLQAASLNVLSKEKETSCCCKE